MDGRRVKRILLVVVGSVFGLAILALFDYCGLISPDQWPFVNRAFEVTVALAIVNAIMDPFRDKKGNPPKSE